MGKCCHLSQARANPSGFFSAAAPCSLLCVSRCHHSPSDRHECPQEQMGDAPPGHSDKVFPFLRALVLQSPTGGCGMSPGTWPLVSHSTGTDRGSCQQLQPWHGQEICRDAVHCCRGPGGCSVPHRMSHEVGLGTMRREELTRINWVWDFGARHLFGCTSRFCGVRRCSSCPAPGAGTRVPLVPGAAGMTAGCSEHGCLLPLCRSGGFLGSMFQELSPRSTGALQVAVPASIPRAHISPCSPGGSALAGGGKWKVGVTLADAAFLLGTVCSLRPPAQEGPWAEHTMAEHTMEQPLQVPSGQGTAGLADHRGGGLPSAHPTVSLRCGHERLFPSPVCHVFSPLLF